MDTLKQTVVGANNVKNSTTVSTNSINCAKNDRGYRKSKPQKWQRQRMQVQAARAEIPNDASGFTQEQDLIMSKFNSTKNDHLYLRQAINFVSVRNMPSPQFEKMCRVLLAELKSGVPVYKSHIANVDHKYYVYLNNKTYDNYNPHLEREIKNMNVGFPRFQFLCKQGMLVNTYPVTPFGVVLKTRMKRNIYHAFRLRTACCDHPQMIMEEMTSKIVVPKEVHLCKHHCKSLEFVNSHFRKYNAVKKFPSAGMNVMKYFEDKLSRNAMTVDDWDWLLDLSARYRLDMDLGLSDFWRIGSLFRHNSMAFSSYLEKIINYTRQTTLPLPEAQGLFSTLTGGILDGVPAAVDEVTSLVSSVNVKIVDSIHDILQFIKDQMTNVKEVMSELAKMSNMIAVGTTLVDFAYVVNFTDMLMRINQLYNLLPYKLPFREVVKSASYSVFPIIENLFCVSSVQAQGLLELLPTIDNSHNHVLAQLAWGVVCAGISGKILSETSLKSFISKYGLTQVRGFGFDSLFTYIRNGDSASRVIEFLQDFLNLCGFDFATWNSLTISFDNMVDIAEKAKDMLNDNEKVKVFSRQSDAIEIVDDWISQLDSFTIQYAKQMKSFMQGRQSQCMTMHQHIIQMRKELTALKAKVVFNVQNLKLVNQAIWIDFTGASGIGKTWTVKNRIFPVLQKSCNILSNLYVRSKTKHFDGHSGETCFLYDDYNQMDDDKAKEIFELTSGCPQILPKADVTEKGLAIIPELVLTTSNKATILKAGKVASVEAFERRRTLLVEVRLDPSKCPIHCSMPEFVSCGGTTCGRVPSVETLQFRIKPSFSRLWDKESPQPWMSMRIFLPSLIQMVNSYREQSEVFEEDEFEEQFCDMSLATEFPTFVASQNFDSPKTHVSVEIPSLHADGSPVCVDAEVEFESPKGLTPFEKFSIFSHNINGFQDARVDKLIHLLENSSYDVVCLQEVSQSQFDRLIKLQDYYAFSTRGKIRLVTLVRKVWKATRIKPLIAASRTPISIDFKTFTVTNFHLQKGENVFYPDGSHVFCGDTNGFNNELFVGGDLEPTYGDEVYDIIGSSKDILSNLKTLGKMQSDHRALRCDVVLLLAQGSFEIHDGVELHVDVSDVWNFLRGLTTSRLKTYLTLAQQLHKQGGEMFSYLWEDSLCDSVQNIAEAADISMFVDNPQMANFIFALCELMLYMHNTPKDISTISMLLKRMCAFAMHITQPHDLITRMARHSSYNGENFDDMSFVRVIIMFLKYALSADFSLMKKFCNVYVPEGMRKLKEFNYSGGFFTPSCLSSGFTKSFELVKSTVSDCAYWTMHLSQEGFIQTFEKQCAAVSNFVQSFINKCKEMSQYLVKYLQSNPLIVSGGLAMLILAGHFAWKKMNGGGARILSYDEMYNVTKEEAPVVLGSFVPSSVEENTFVFTEIEDEFCGALEDEQEENVRRRKQITQGVQTDETLMTSIIPALRKNMVTVTCNGYTIGGIFVAGTTLLLPKHFILGAGIKGVEKVIIKSGAEPVETQVDFGNRQECIKSTVSDIMFINFARNNVQSYRNISEHFMDETTLKNISSETICMMARKNERVSCYTERFAKARRNADVAYTLNGSKIIANLGLKYKLPTVAGECGAAIFINNTRFNRKLYGIHVAGTKSAGCGYSQAVSCEVVKKAISHFGDVKQPPKVIANGFITEEHIGDIDKARVIPGDHRAAAGNFTYVGTLPNDKVPFSPSKTDLRQTQIFGEVMETVKGPAVLRPTKVDGILRHPMKASLDKYAKPLRSLNIDTLSRIREYMVNKYTNLAKDNQVDFTPYSTSENILGREGGLGRIPTNTSAGYPYTVRKIKKEQCFDYDKGVVNEDLMAEINDTEKRMEEGYHSGQVWTDCLKDEKRSLEKIAEVKTRTFAIPSVVTTFLTRKYFGPVVDFLTALRIQTPFTVGINAEGPEWTTLFQKHNEHSNCIIAGDYSKYDGTTPPELVQLFAEVVNALCYDQDKSEGRVAENQAIRHQICAELTHTLQLCENLLYFTHQGIPSGSPLTVYINTFVNECLMLFAYLEIAKEDGINAATATWETDVLLSAYGDDNMLSVSRTAVEWYNFESIQRTFENIGLKYTPESKDDSTYKYKSIYDVSFLKRKFVRDKVNPRYILAPIDTSSIYELFNWYRTGCNEDDILYVNIHDALRKAHAHGKLFFDRLLFRVNEVLTEHELERVNVMWSELDREWRMQFW